MDLLPASPEATDQALTILRRGGVVAHATETCYGLACDLTNRDAVKKLFAIKQRPEDQPVSALFPSIDEAKKYVEWSDEAEKFAEKYLPGPLTIILPVRSDAPHQLFPTNVSGSTWRVVKTSRRDVSTVGVRVSLHPIAQELVSRFGRPLSTTSANIHGQPEPYSVEDIQKQFIVGALFDVAQGANMPDLVIDSGQLSLAKPSTIVAFVSGKMHIVRQGDTRID